MFSVLKFNLSNVARGSRGCLREDSTWNSCDQVLISARERIEEPDRCRKAKGIYETKVHT